MTSDSADLLILGGLLVTMDDNWTVLGDGGLAIKGGAIVGRGTRAEIEASYQAPEVIPADEHLVIPGLINAHTHAAMTAFRGLADDLPLDVWLKEYIWPAEGRTVTAEMVYWSTLLAAAEMIRSGTTLFADMYFFEDEVGRAAQQAGIRAVLGEALVDFPSPNTKTPEEGLAYVRASFERWAGHPLVQVALQPHSAYACSPELLVRSKALADEWKAILLLHACETAQEIREVQARNGGQTPVELLESLALLDRNVVFAHGVHVTRDEIALLAERGVSIAHCPESNMKLASGVAPVPAYLAAGVNVALGTDGTASNNDLNLWGELQTAARLHKVFTGDPTVIPARQAVWMATRGGARALGCETRLGSLEVGKRADVVLINLNRPHLVPLYDPYSHLTYAVRAADVTTVIIEGRVVLQDGELLTIDEEEVFAHLRELAQDLGTQWGRDANWRVAVGQ